MLLLFVDLRKAYNSAPRAALWCALQKYGVPDAIIALIGSLRNGISATVTVGGGMRTFLTPKRFAARMYFGIHTVYPVLGLVIERWFSRCQTAGLVVSWLERGLEDQVLLHCKNIFLQATLLWCALVERIWSWLLKY